MNSDEMLDLADQIDRADLISALRGAALQPREQIAELCNKAAELLEQMQCNERRYLWIRENPFFAEEEILREEELDEAIDQILSGQRMCPEEERAIRAAEFAAVKPYKPEYEYPNCAPMDPPRPLFE